MLVYDEQTLFMFKPDALERKIWPEILEELANMKNISIVAIKLVPFVTKKMLDAHYSEHVGKDFYHRLESGMIGKPVMPVVLQGESVIFRVRNLLGDTAPDKAAKGTIRQRFSDDNYELSKQEDRMVRNVGHASEHAKASKQEISAWFKPIEIMPC